MLGAFLQLDVCCCLERGLNYIGSKNWGRFSTCDHFRGGHKNRVRLARSLELVCGCGELF